MAGILFKISHAQLKFLSVTVGVSLIAPLIMLGATVGLILAIPDITIDTTSLSIYFIVTCTAYNIFLMLLISVGKVEEGEDIGHYFSIIVPAHNEENVIAGTLEHIANFDYPQELFEVIVINDGSTDKTERVIHRLQKKYPNIKLINVPREKGGNGKGSALNTGFADFLLTWRGLEIKPRHRWVIGVFDADGMPDRDMLRKASFQFNDPKVGGVQTVVRIKNRKHSLLAKMQDIEFITFARSVQFARTIFNGSVALGGNGQFVRATALETSNLKHLGEYWKTESLTEDLDISVRLLMLNWENRYLDSTAVHQEGAESIPVLIRQRTRWSWGTLQALVSYVFNLKIWRSKISLRKKLDISIYLIHVTLPLVVLLCYLWTGLSFLGILKIQNAFPFAFCLANAFSFIPFFIYSLWKERGDYPVKYFVPLISIALVYTYHWIPCVTSAILKMLLCKPTWFKTPRFTKSTQIS